MKSLIVIVMVAVLAMAILGCAERHPEVLAKQTARATEDGIALAIVYDNSGSMGEDVKNSKGKNERKDLVARRAMIKVIETLKSYSERSGKKIQVGIVKFDGVAVEMQDFSYPSLMGFAKKAENDGLNTPLGVTMESAIGMVLQSPMAEKHVIVLTDGMSNAGPDPQEILSSPEYKAVSSEFPVGIYYVAYDIGGSCFNKLDSLGVKIFEAVDEKQLDENFSNILQKEILFEDPEQ